MDREAYPLMIPLFTVTATGLTKLLGQDGKVSQREDLAPACCLKSKSAKPSGSGVQPVVSRTMEK